MIQVEKQEKIMFDLMGKSGIVIEQFDSEGGDTAFRLLWTDYIANTWAEYYPTLAIALMRVAMLSKCVESDGDLSFAFDQMTFEHHAENFIGKEVQ